MAFIVASYFWLWKAYRGKPLGHDFIHCVWMAQIPAFIFSAVISLSVGAYDYFSAGVTPFIFGEVLILGGLFALLGFYPMAGVDSFAQRAAFMFLKFGHLCLFGFVCIFGWGITVAVSFFMIEVLRIITVMNQDDFQIAVFFISGLMWNVPIIFMYSKILKSADTRVFLQGHGIRGFLWPVLSAYFMLLIPFLIQNIANSQEWHDAKNKKVVRTAESILHGDGFKESLSFSHAPV